MCNRFITDTCNQLRNDHQLSLGSSCSAQMFQNSNAILVGPIVEHFTEEKDRDVLLLPRLRFEEVLYFPFKR